MSKTPNTVSPDFVGRAAPPRDNGELIFAAPWQGRAFGITMALCDTHIIDWQDFRSLLIEEIARWDNNTLDHELDWSYYHCWLLALERALTNNQLLSKQEIDGLLETFEGRLDGHDH